MLFKQIHGIYGFSIDLKQALKIIKKIFEEKNTCSVV